MGLYLTAALQGLIHVYGMLSMHGGRGVEPGRAYIVISNNVIPLTFESLFTLG